MTIAIVIARGGSKRLPRKNVKLFCGHPLVAWSIMQARCSQVVDLTVLSTDDDEIEQVGRQYGAEIIRRPDWPDADFTAANRVFAHALDVLLPKYPGFHTMIQLLPTTPLRKPGNIDTVTRFFWKIGADIVSPMAAQRETVLYRKTHEYSARLEVWDKTYAFLRQSYSLGICSPQWYRNYVSYFSDQDSVLDDMKNHPRVDQYFFPAELWQDQDVDTQQEFEIAEVLMEHFILKGKGMEVYNEYERNAKSNA
jgi:CMP-N-acetylneuraminic acid synthetase